MMLKNVVLRLIFVGLAVSVNTVQAEINAVIGNWITIDDDTGKAVSEVEIWREGDTLQGKIVKLLNNPEKTVCDQCKGELKGKNIEGLTILFNFNIKGEKWSNGQVLDPKNGKTYKASIKLQDEGNRLKVRGYIGIPALGRTQFWNKKAG